MPMSYKGPRSMLCRPQERNPSTHSTIDMPDQQLALIVPSKQATFVVAGRKIPQPGPGEVLVRVQATALNPFDAKIHKDGTFVDSYPAVLGTDGAGIVEEVGEGVTRFDPGDRMYAVSLLRSQCCKIDRGLLDLDSSTVPSTITIWQP